MPICLCPVSGTFLLSEGSVLILISTTPFLLLQDSNNSICPGVDGYTTEP